ncbi:glycosyltransferase [Sciscionella sediminilitoris]|uniref:glycosyltransferase n=1 Tax=Sciscionella sediminilitoris TaxID=1445613 RepID=UPI0004DF3540|nr:glycosyltransferase [Sciscionella sp. SE31]
MRVLVELPEELDAEQWRARHAEGAVPDATPYGLHRIGDARTAVRFRPPLRRATGIATKVRNRLGGYDVLAKALAPHRFGADVLLCMDERTGIPAALHPGRTPVVSGIAWLEDPRSLSAAHARLAATGMRRMAAVFSQSPALTPALCEHWDLDPGRVHEIDLGIDEQFYPAQPEETAGPIVASVGDDRNRDHATLVAAVAAARAGGTGCTLELATTLPVEVPESLGVVHRKRMGAGMRGIYRRCGLVAVALHENRVGSGLTVVLEAMASARPIVVTANPGMERYVRHGIDGLLVPAGDPAAMGAAIGELLADPQRCRAMGRAARARVRERFTSAHMAGQLRELLGKAVRR